MEREYTIQELLSIFVKKLWLIILLSIIGLCVGFGISKFFITPKYSSSISMYIKNGNTVNGNAINSSDLTASQQLVNTYIVILQDDSVMKQLVINLNKDYSIEEMENLLGVSIDSTDITKKNTLGVLGTSSSNNEYASTISILGKYLKSVITMSSKDNTEILNVVATTTSSQFSADICNNISSIAPGVLIRVTKAGSVQTIGMAEPSLAPVSPDIKKNAIIGFGIGFILSMAIIFLIDLFDTTLKSSSTLANNFNLVNLGQLSDVSNSHDKKKSKSDVRINHSILDKNIPFYFIEAFKLIRTNIMFSIATKNNNIVAVSSANAGEGKSMVSSNIAISLAQTDKKVLLIDCDLRKPVQHKVFKLKNKSGISQYISNMANLDDIIQHNVIENLDIITSGVIPPNPSEIIASDNMKTFLTEISKQYDYVIIDTPPINVVSDVIGLSTSVAGLIFVARYQQTKYADVSTALDNFNVANMNVLGFILNGGAENYSKYGKYNKYYKKYKSYEYKEENNS